MSTKLTAILVASGLLPLCAQAPNLDDLNAQIQKLSAQVNQLQKQQAAAAAAEPTAAKAVASNTPNTWLPWSTPANPVRAGAPSATTTGPLSVTIKGATFALYGDFDVYANHMKSSSGHTINALEDGAILRSRWGIKGDKPVAPGYEMKFTLESGFNTLNGKSADTATTTNTSTTTGGVTTVNSTTGYSGRLFDRQAWFGVLTPIGEFRIGRQNTTIQQLGGEIDFAARNLGGVINLFGVPSRYDNDVSYLSRRFYGFTVQLHYAFANSLAGVTTTNSVNGNIANIGNQRVYQVMADYKMGPWTAGYMEIVAEPPAGGTNKTAPLYATNVVYQNPYVNYNYGKGMVWLAAVHSNNNGASGALFNGNGPLSNTAVTSTGTLNTAPMPTSTPTTTSTRDRPATSSPTS